MSVDLDALRRKHQELQEKSSGGGDFLDKFLRLNEGTNLVRILPPTDDTMGFFAETAIHRVEDGGNTKNIHCRAVSTPNHDSEPCPLCNFVSDLWNRHRALKLPKGEKSKFGNLASKIKATSRYYINALERESGEVKILSVGTLVFNMILNTFCDEDYGDITDVNNGHDYKIVKTMTEDGKWPRYNDSQPRPKPSALADSDKEIQEILGKSHDIHSLVKFPNFDDVQLVVAGLAAEYEISTPSTAPVEEGGDDSDYLKKMAETEKHED